MSLISQMYPVRSFLELIAAEVQKQFDEPITVFDIVYNSKSETPVVFRKPTGFAPPKNWDYYPFDSSALGDGIKAIASEQIAADQTLDYVIIHFDRNNAQNCFADIYAVNSGGEKIKTKFDF